MADKDVAIYQAIEPFYADGMTIQAGDTVVAGHPILKGRLSLFRPFEPTYDLARDKAAATEAHRAHAEAEAARIKAEEEAAAEAAKAGSYAELQERGKALGLKVVGVKKADLEEAIAAAEAEAKATDPEATG
jgi:multidrug efflux pump subunit AcrA (membrane-fusion protein)